MQTYLALAHLDSEAGYLLTQLASAGTTVRLARRLVHNMTTVQRLN